MYSWLISAYPSPRPALNGDYPEICTIECESPGRSFSYFSRVQLHVRRVNSPADHIVKTPTFGGGPDNNVEGVEIL